MEGLIIGLDLCDAYTQISCVGKEKIWSFPTVLCKKKDEDLWVAGEDVHSLCLEGGYVRMDKLYGLSRRDRTFVIDGKEYSGLDLLRRFLKLIIGRVLKECGEKRILQLVITLVQVDSRMMDRLLYCADYLGIPRKRFHVISHGESFIYYVLNQKKEVWSNYVGMFELSPNGLRYYEMKVQKGIRQTTVFSDSETLMERFDFQLLESDFGVKKTDQMLCAHAQRLMAKKLYSAVLLTGRGFEKWEWASGFMDVLGRRRKVYGESSLYVKGAAYRASDYLKETTAFPYVMACEGRLEATVSMEVILREKPTPLVIAAAGDNWYEARSTMECILDNQKELVFSVQRLDSRKKNEVRISLEEFPSRPNRTTRVQIRVVFLDEHTMVVMVKDKGFGELFPSSNAVIRKEIQL